MNTSSLIEEIRVKAHEEPLDDDECAQLEEIIKDLREADRASHESGEPAALTVPGVGGWPGCRVDLLASHSERYTPANPRKLTEQQVFDLAVTADGDVAAQMAVGQRGDLLEESARREARRAVELAKPQNPMEEMLVRSCSLSMSSQRQLAILGAQAGDPKVRQRYAELSQKAAREVSRSCITWTTMRKPPQVHVEQGAQANVVAGDQVINQANGGAE